MSNSRWEGDNFWGMPSSWGEERGSAALGGAWPRMHLPTRHHRAGVTYDSQRPGERTQKDTRLGTWEPNGRAGTVSPGALAALPTL